MFISSSPAGRCATPARAGRGRIDHVDDRPGRAGHGAGAEPLQHRGAPGPAAETRRRSAARSPASPSRQPSGRAPAERRRRPRVGGAAHRGQLEAGTSPAAARPAAAARCAGRAAELPGQRGNPLRGGRRVVVGDVEHAGGVASRRPPRVARAASSTCTNEVTPAPSPAAAAAPASAGPAVVPVRVVGGSGAVQSAVPQHPRRRGPARSPAVPARRRPGRSAPSPGRARPGRAARPRRRPGRRAARRRRRCSARRGAHPGRAGGRSGGRCPRYAAAR